MKNESEQLEKTKELYNLIKNNQFDPSSFQVILKTNQYLIEFNTNFKFIYDSGRFGIASLNDERYKDTISKNRFIALCAVTGACTKGIDFIYNIGESIYQFKILNIKDNTLNIYINDYNPELEIKPFCIRKYIKSVIILNTVTSIGDTKFYGCNSLESITIPNSVTSIGYQAFEYCHSLESITIPNSVTSIGYNAFFGCTSLTSITIPNSVTTIGIDIFFGCTSLTSIIVPDQRTAEVILENNPKVKDLIKIQPVNESKYSKQQLLEAINYWTNVLNESRTIRSIPFRKTKKFLK